MKMFDYKRFEIFSRISYPKRLHKLYSYQDKPRNLIIFMKFNLKSIRYSQIDIQKGIKIPKKLTTLLAEDIGIHIGDGSLYKSNASKSTYEFFYSFNAREEDYLNQVLEIKRKLYNLKKYKITRINNELRLRFYSLAIALFYKEALKIPVGKKSRIIIVPPYILGGKANVIVAFLRGIIDTDFCLRFVGERGYPRFTSNFASKSFVMDLKSCFAKLGIHAVICLDMKKTDKRTSRCYNSNYIALIGLQN